jgi:hypothetical protein
MEDAAKTKTSHRPPAVQYERTMVGGFTVTPEMVTDSEQGRDLIWAMTT